MIIRLYLKSLLASAALVLALGTAEARAQHQVTNVGPPGGDVRGLAVSAVEPHVVYALINPNRLYRAHGSGLETRMVSEGSGNIPISIHPSDPNVIYQGSRRSFDGGVTWHDIDVLLVQALFNPVNTSFIWGVVHNVSTGSRELWKSHDAGDSWSLLSSARLGQVVVSAADTSLLYALEGAPANTPVRSEDGGVSWNPIGPDEAHNGVGVSPTDASTVFTSGPGGIYRSTDSGDSWTLVFSPAVADVQVHPKDPLRVYARSSNDFFISLDGGDTWESRIAGVEHVGSAPGYGEVRKIALDAKQPGRIYLGLSHWGVYESADDGMTWTWTRIAPASVVDIAPDPQQPDRILVGTQDQGLLVTTDAGSSWTRADVETDSPPHEVNHIFEIVFSRSDPQRAYFAALWHDVFHSVDGGHSWQPATPIGQSTWALGVDVHPTAPDSVIVATGAIQPNGLLLSSDGGAGWSPIFFAPLEVTHVRFVPEAPNVILANLVGPGLLYQSPDSGITWHEISGDIRAHWVHVDASSDSRIYVAQRAVAGVPGGVFRTRSDVIDWEELNLVPYVDGSIVSARRVTTSPSSPQTLYVALDSGLYVSEDDGSSWRQIKARSWMTHGIGGNVKSPALVADPHVDGRLWVADVDGIKRIDLAQISVEPVRNGGESLYLFPPFPNPATSRVTIRFQAPAGHPLRLEVIDLLGRRVATLFDEKVMTSGPIDLRWEASPSGLRLPSGTYVIRARSGEHTVEQMVTIVR